MSLVTVRRAEAEDRGFLEQMLSVAAYWQESKPRPVDEVLRTPGLAHYIAGWPQPNDFGVIAEDEDRPLGAAWWRYFPATDPGYGFVSSDIPEVSIGVLAGSRGVGVGTLLIGALLA